MARYLMVVTAGLLLAVHFASAGLGQPDYVSFEVLPDGSPLSPETILTTQYHAWGILFEPHGQYAAYVVTELTHGVVNFGNSPITTVCIGYAGMAGVYTDILFVEPLTETPRPVSEIRILIGDGDIKTETFQVTVFDSEGAVLHTEQQTTWTAGYQFMFTSPDSAIARARLTQGLPTESGAVFDDIYVWPAVSNSSVTPLEERTQTSLRLAYPNPFRDTINIPISLKARPGQGVEIFSVSGRRVAAIPAGVATTSIPSVTWDPRQANLTLPPGTYFIRVPAEVGGSTLRVIYQP